MEREKWLHEEENLLVRPKYFPGVAMFELPMLRWPPMVKKSARTGITPEILLDHMRGMERRLQMDFMREIGEVRTIMNVRFDRVDARLERVEKRIDWLAVARDNLGERLDDIEVVQIPKLKKAVSMR